MPPLEGNTMMLTDTRGRVFKYLRLSVTDACNYRCTYCLPNGYVRQDGWSDPLSGDEIERAVRGFAGLGVEKVRLTGGEPTSRRDIVDLTRRVAAVDGIRTVALSTNGYRLAGLVDDLAAAGLKQVNVSVDALSAERYRAITGRDCLGAVLRGVDAAIARGLVVKANVVLLRDTNDDEIERFLEWARVTDISVRFIELMRTADNASLFAAQHVSLGALEKTLAERGFVRRLRKATDGPAMTFSHPGYRGTIGLIAPYGADFCEGCNRLRVTSRGELRLCLFGDGGVSFRHLLQQPAGSAAIADFVRAALVGKPAAHRLAEGIVGDTKNLAQMGG